MSFPRYPKYKSSGVDWLGDVPEHWEIVPFYHSIKFQEGPGIMAVDFREEGVPLLRVSCVQERWVTLDGCNYLDPEKVSLRWDHFRVESGDLLISASASMGTICEVDSNAAGSIPYTGLIRLTAKTTATTKDYIRAVLGSSLFTTQIDLLKAGATIQHFGPSHLSQMKVLLPPLSEQSAIASFLDHETGKIDGLVEEQRRLIALLKEKRQAVISHAVTKGLNPLAPMKPSGVEWLGDVPEHWELFSLKRDLDFLTSGSRGWAENYSDEGDIFIRITNLTRDGISIDLSDIQRVAVPDGAEGARTRVQSGDVLFSITAYLGSVAVIPETFETAYVSQHIALARLRHSRLIPRWVGYVALSIVGKTWFQTQSYGGTKIQLSLDDVRDLPIPAPPIEEQHEIVSFITNQVFKFDTLTAEAHRAIDLLQERRMALISAAVTGKIDVRSFHHG